MLIKFIQMELKISSYKLFLNLDKYSYISEKLFKKNIFFIIKKEILIISCITSESYISCIKKADREIISFHYHANYWPGSNLFFLKGKFNW